MKRNQQDFGFQKLQIETFFTAQENMRDFGQEKSHKHFQEAFVYFPLKPFFTSNWIVFEVMSKEYFFNLFCIQNNDTLKNWLFE